MSHNESLTDREIEPVKPSKLTRVKDAAIITGIFVIPAAVIAASMYASIKMTSTQLETAKLNLETAKLNRQS